jgi:hypothetical protein
MFMPLARIRITFVILLMVLCLSIPAIAHNGPPFRVIADQKAGPCIVSVWAHANIGTSPFFVMLKPLPGGKIPDDLKVEIAVQPKDGQTPEKHYVAARESNSDEVQYTSDVTLDSEGAWKIRVVLESASAGNGEVSATVQATPHGYGHWDLLLYALPFLALGLLFTGAVVRRLLAGKNLQREASCS